MLFDTKSSTPSGCRVLIIYANPDIDMFYLPYIKWDPKQTTLSNPYLPEFEEMDSGARNLIRRLAINHLGLAPPRRLSPSRPSSSGSVSQTETITLMIDLDRFQASYGEDVVDACLCRTFEGRLFWWWKYLEQGFNVDSCETTTKLSLLLTGIWHFNGLKLDSEDSYKELRVHDLQVRLRLLHGQKFSQCNHDIRAEPVSRYGS
jgi:hypothetical protein